MTRSPNRPPAPLTFGLSPVKFGVMILLCLMVAAAAALGIFATAFGLAMSGDNLFTETEWAAAEYGWPATLGAVPVFVAGACLAGFWLARRVYLLAVAVMILAVPAVVVATVLVPQLVGTMVVALR